MYIFVGSGKPLATRGIKVSFERYGRKAIRWMPVGRETPARGQQDTRIDDSLGFHRTWPSVHSGRSWSRQVWVECGHCA